MQLFVPMEKKKGYESQSWTRGVAPHVSSTAAGICAGISSRVFLLVYNPATPSLERASLSRFLVHARDVTLQVGSKERGRISTAESGARGDGRTNGRCVARYTGCPLGVKSRIYRASRIERSKTMSKCSKVELKVEFC